MDNWLQELLGIQNFKYDNAFPVGLPFYMVNGRSIERAIIGDISFFIVHLDEMNRFGTIALKKQLEAYIAALQMPVAFSFSELNSRQAKALIERQIPFIYAPNQVYLPFLGVVLSNSFVQRRQVPAEKMTASSQVLFLHFLYRTEKESITKTAVAKALRMNKMTISRAAQQLLDMQLIAQDVRGKQHWINAVTSGWEYYQLGKPFLMNPIQEVVTTEMKSEFLELPISGETALSEVSLLNSPSISVRAAFKGHKWIKEAPRYDERWDTNRELVKIEAWKYDPFLFSREGAVDPVSLEASLRDNADERVQGELEEYLRGLKW